MKVTDELKKELDIEYCGDNYLTFTDGWSDINFNVYNDNDIGIEIQEGDQEMAYSLSQKQIAILIKWLQIERRIN